MWFPFSAGTDILKKRQQDLVMGAPPVPDYAIIKPLNPTPNHIPRSKSMEPGEPPLPANNVERPHTRPMDVLVGSVLQSALSGSSTQVAEKLNKMEEEPVKRATSNRTHAAMNRVNHNSRASSVASSEVNSIPPSASQKGGTVGPPPFTRSYAVPDQLPAGRRNDRFSELLNSTVVNDHFDQYGTLKDDSGLGKDFEFPDEMMDAYPPNGHTYHHHQQNPRERYKSMPRDHVDHTAIDRSPDSGVSDTDDPLRSSQSKSLLQRRRTLPSIIKRVPSFSKSKSKAKPAAGETIQSQQNLNEKESDTYIIENGIRKRVKAEVHAQPAPPVAESSDNVTSDKLKDLPKRYTLESPSRLRRSGGKRGSLPDVSHCKDVELMPREQVSLMSEKRREEIRLLREAEERRRAQEIVLRFGDLKVCISLLWTKAQSGALVVSFRP